MKRSQFLVLPALAEFLDLGLPFVGALEAVGRLLVVAEGLLDLLLGVHHEGAVLRDGLVQRLSADQHEPASLLGGEPVPRLFLLAALAEQAAVHVVDQLLVLVDHLSLVHKDNGIPLAWDRQLECSAGQHVHVEVVRRRPRVDRPGLALPLAGNDLHFHPVALEHFDLVTRVLLVGGLDHLVLALEVDPQLEAQRVLLVGSRNFRVQDAPSRGHPLQVARPDLPLVAFEVLVVEVALLHVRDRLEASVRVVGEARGQSDLEVVEHEEGIQVSEVLVSDDTDDLGPFALVDPSWLEDERHCVNKQIEQQ